MYTQLTGSEVSSAPMTATVSQKRLCPRLLTCAARTASVACSGFFEGCVISCSTPPIGSHPVIAGQILIAAKTAIPMTA